LTKTLKAARKNNLTALWYKNWYLRKRINYVTS